MIKIDDKYYIGSNLHSYVLMVRSVVQDKESSNFGKESFKDCGYYADIESLIKGYRKMITREYLSTEKETTFAELINEIKRQTKYIESLNLNV